MISRLWLNHYRNFETLSLDFTDSKHFYVVGDNNQGKTNLLESIYTLAYLRGPKESSVENLILLGRDQSDLAVDFKKLDQSYRMYLRLSKTKKKEIFINQEKQNRYRGVRDLFPVQYLSADVIKLFQGFADTRRQVLDTFLSEYDESYAVTLKKYQTINKQKYVILKQGGAVDVLKLYNQQLIPYASEIVRKRVLILKDLNQMLLSLLGEFPHLEIQSVDIKYCAKSFDQIDDYQDLLTEKLNRNMSKEIAAKATLYGPHKDDFECYLDQKQLQVFWSRGINRTVSVLFLLSIACLLQRKTNSLPVFLLDDTFVEIDDHHKERLIKLFLDRTQVFYASTQTMDYKFFNNTQIKRMRKGILHEVS